MTDTLNKSTRAKARELARQITVAHDLDPEIQEELYGHIEDKLLAYMSGEEAITEEDALILVREHFGDTRAVRSMLLGVHGGALEVGLFRRVLALAITILAVQAGLHLLRPFVLLPLKLGGMLHNPTQSFLSTAFLGLGSLLLCYALLKRWRRQERAGATPWYITAPTRRLVGWCGGVLVLSWLVPAVTMTADDTAPAHLTLYLWIISIGALGLSVASCLLWLWWTEAPARPLFTNLFLGALWVAFGFLKTIYPAKFFLVVGDGSFWSGATSVLQGHLGDTPCTLYLTYGGSWSSMDAIVAVFLPQFIVALVLCLITAAVHARFRPGRGPAPTSAE